MALTRTHVGNVRGGHLKMGKGVVLPGKHQKHANLEQSQWIYTYT